MPLAAPTPCNKPGCGKLNCVEHRDAMKRERQQRVDAQRGSSAQRGYGSRWQKARATYLRQHPLCQCDECGDGALRVKAAVVVDHKVPHRGDQALFWDTSNWQSLAKVCHDKKTATQDGGFGNKGRGDQFPKSTTG